MDNSLEWREKKDILRIYAYLAQLRAAEKRLDSLIREDRSVRLSFDLSYQMLSPQLPQFFTSLGAFGGDDFSAQAAAHVAGVAEKDTLHYLSELILLSLVQRGRPERYSLHPLLRDFAREKQSDTQFSQRMIHWFVEFAEHHAADYAQVGIELSNLTFAEEALHVAREVNAPEAVAQALINLGQCATYSGAISAATNHFQEALVITQEADLVWLAATAHLYRGELYLKTGKNTAARRDFTLALETANTLNAPEQKATALFGLARVYLSTQQEQSIRYARESAAIFAELGHFTVDSVRQWIDNVSLDATC